MASTRISVVLELEESSSTRSTLTEELNRRRGWDTLENGYSAPVCGRSVYRLWAAVIVVVFGQVLEPRLDRLGSCRWRRVSNPGCKLRDTLRPLIEGGLERPRQAIELRMRVLLRFAALKYVTWPWYITRPCYLSEEAYSREDKRLLASVASQAGLALESIRLGEEVAERIEVEQRAARDMEIAKQVQARLFPQKLPPLDTLEYAGRCIQARDVGGHDYDFLSLGAGRMGIVLADIVGKGIPGALLMANLQADVRSQCAIASQDLPQFLKSVNQAFYESTDEGGYATLFFGDYQDSTRRLRFVNPCSPP